MKHNERNTGNLKFAGTIVYGIIALWFAFALQMGAEGRFVSGPHTPPLALGLTLAVPVLFFVVAWFQRGLIWEFCRTLDLRFVVAVQLARIFAIDFLLCVAEGRLPAGFGLPAGIGDILTALAAVPLASAISRGAPAAKKRFIAWNIFGLLDLILAVTLGILHSPSSLGVLAGSGPTTLLMSQLPRSLVPTFFVPLYMLLHLLALARRKEVTTARADGDGARKVG